VIKSKRCHTRITVQFKLRQLRTSMLFSIRVSQSTDTTSLAVPRTQIKYITFAVIVDIHTALVIVELSTMHACVQHAEIWVTTKTTASQPGRQPRVRSPNLGRRIVYGQGHQRVTVHVACTKSQNSRTTSRLMMCTSTPSKYTPRPQRPGHGLKRCT